MVQYLTPRGYVGVYERELGHIEIAANLYSRFAFHPFEVVHILYIFSVAVFSL